MQYLRKQNREEALPFHFTGIGRWWDKTNELDIMAATETGKDYLIGECKFKNKPFRYSEYLDTTFKLSPYREKAEFYYYLFSESGFDEKITIFEIP